MNWIQPSLLSLTMLATSLSAQQSRADNYRAKLQKDFAKLVKWQRSLETAQKIAKIEDKLIFGYFTRSYSP